MKKSPKNYVFVKNCITRDAGLTYKRRLNKRKYASIVRYSRPESDASVWTMLVPKIAYIGTWARTSCRLSAEDMRPVRLIEV